MDVEVVVEGEVQLNRRLLIVADGINDFSEPLTNLGGELQKTFQDNFAEEGSLFGGWPARQDDNDWPILDKTGLMKSSFQQEVGALKLTITNTAPYFPYHQSNKPRSTNLPRRIMMMIDDERKQLIIKELQAYIVKLVRGG